MDKKEYIIAQLGRTKNKKHEAYVVTRIIHLLNNFDVKFVTQQHVSRPDGRALTDLYFPQFGIHIEVDEGQHEKEGHRKSDQIRDADILNATGSLPIRIKVTKTFDEINHAIDEVVEDLKVLASAESFIAWDIVAEFNPQTYIDLGYIDVLDNVAFKTIKDACNCFGHNYKGYQSAGAPHPNPEIMLWFPKLFPNGEWDNQISDDEEIIIERNEDDEKTIAHVSSHLNNKKHKHQRITFAKVKGNLGDTLYRFRGLYKLDTDNSNGTDGLIWKRTSTRVNTFPKP